MSGKEAFILTRTGQSEEHEEEETMEELGEVEEEKKSVETLENCDISLQELNGTMGFKTLRLRGFTEQKPLEEFIDCGSTHDFIDEEVVMRLGCEITKIKP